MVWVRMLQFSNGKKDVKCKTWIDEDSMLLQGFSCSSQNDTLDFINYFMNLFSTRLQNSRIFCEHAFCSH